MAAKGKIIKFSDAGVILAWNSFKQLIKKFLADPDVQDLARKSLEARKAAYAPFSEFAVGAALKCSDGSVALGCNVENSTYPAGICAERTACTKAVSQGLQTFSAIAVCADKANGDITTPCGICRQFLFEFAPDIPVYCVSSDLQEILISSVNELLPYGFRLKPKAAKLWFLSSSQAY